MLSFCHLTCFDDAIAFQFTMMLILSDQDCATIEPNNETYTLEGWVTLQPYPGDSNQVSFKESKKHEKQN